MGQRRMNDNKLWKIIDKEFISYSGGYAYLISNGDCKFHVWEKKEDAQKVCDKLNDFRTKISKLELDNTSLVMLNQEMSGVLDICINLMEECNLKDMKELQDVVREACKSKGEGR